MFDPVRHFILQEERSTGPHPRQALRVVDPPIPVEIAVATFLPDDKPRWAERPIWLRVAGVDRHPVRGLLHAWVCSETADWYGIVSMELGSRLGQLRIALPRQLVPGKAIRPLNE